LAYLIVGSVPEAFPAINRTISPRVEGNLSFAATTAADYIKHFSFPGEGTVGLTFAGSAAVRATGREVLKALFRIKFLFASCESKVVFAFPAL
jgi:hypothetical protein